MPSRLATLRKVIPAIINQLDRLYLFLDGYEDVPDFARHEKIVVLRSATDGRLGASGKFLGLMRENKPCVYITFDDDIRYPADYVATLVRALIRFEGRVMVGFHGTFFMPPYTSFVNNAYVCHFRYGLAHDIRVDMLGTGTTALISSLLPIDPCKWPDIDVDDLLVSVEAEKRGMPRVAIARRQHYLDSLDENQADSLWARVRKNDARQTHHMNELLTLERRSRLGLPPRPYSTPAPISAGWAFATQPPRVISAP